MSDDVLKHWAHGIAEAEMMSDLPGGDPWADPMHCIADLAAALREEREQRAEIERKAIEQSEYIQAHGLTEYEVARLKAQVETTTWYNGTLLTELSTLRERVAELETEWQQEHTERICLEERVKYLGTRLESEIEAALEAARKGETC